MMEPEKEENDMPLPLKPGYNFNYAHIYRPPHFEMTAAETYTDFYALSYTISGEQLVYRYNSTFIIRSGDITFTAKNVYERSGYVSDTPRENILIKFTDCMVDDLMETLGFKDFSAFHSKYPSIHLEKHAQKKILPIIQEIEDEWNSYNTYSELILKGLLHKLILLGLQEGTVNEQTPSIQETKQYYLNSAIHYVKANLRDNPSLEETAGYVNISVSYLSKIFMDYLHTPFSSFVLNEKIQYAQKLLMESNMSMKEIAKEAGFSSSAYFSDCFKRMTGLPPLRFRKKNKEEPPCHFH